MSDTLEPTTFVKIFTEDGSSFCVTRDDEGSVDAAVEQWLSTGETRDTLLHLTMTDGDRVCLKASCIQGWMLSSPEGRRRASELGKAYDDEEKDNRREAGYIEGE